mmetsp:Transcript_106431/g.339620  ORF Transcript_106431/g.339620 Transcript_106431/m.339620 type:complete len:248 (-) Transcript_106431:723-1466(-)
MPSFSWAPSCATALVISIGSGIAIRPSIKQMPRKPCEVVSASTAACSANWTPSECPTTTDSAAEARAWTCPIMQAKTWLRSEGITSFRACRMACKLQMPAGQIRARSLQESNACSAAPVNAYTAPGGGPTGGVTASWRAAGPIVKQRVLLLAMLSAPLVDPSLGTGRLGSKRGGAQRAQLQGTNLARVQRTEDQTGNLTHVIGTLRAARWRFNTSSVLTGDLATGDVGVGKAQTRKSARGNCFCVDL